ncbi:EAL domain-containing protein [Roseixanthobacter glucoisosaccharinicivorans]|uniref:EAL domain-containing protein n=1 Tax=Roseixanthobacter glucoisosaccharinicivorans TaxID=3119923 RepID=UPI003727E4BC
MATILIVDDHAINREFLVTLLKYGDHRLIEAADGTTALAIAQAEFPDLVISDILMPSGDGYELVRALRQAGGLADVPVIFYTAHYNEREALTLAQACGVQYVLTKPADPALILEVVNDVLTRKRTIAPTGQQEHPGFDRKHLRLVSDKLVQATEELEWTTSRLMALIEMSLQIAAEREPLHIARVFCRWTRDLVAARHAVVGLWEPDHPGAGYAAASGLPEDLIGEVESQLLRNGPQPIPIGANGAARHLGEPTDASNLGLPVAFPRVRSLLFVPVRSATRAFGWVCASNKIGRNGFSPDDERLLSIFAAYVGRIFENHCLFSELAERSGQLEGEVAERAAAQWRLESQYALAGVLAETSTIDQAAPEILRTICALAGFQLGELWEVDADAARLRHVATWHADGAAAADFLARTSAYDFPKGSGLLGRAWESGAPVWLDAANLGLVCRRASAVRALGMDSALAFPVVTGGKVIGVLGFFGAGPHTSDPALSALFTAMGSQVGQFIDRRGQELRLVRLSRIRAVLSGINSLIVRVDDRAALLEGACQIAVEEGEFVKAEVVLLEGAAPDGGSRVLRVATYGEGEPPTLPGTGLAPIDTAELIATAIATAAPAIDNDALGGKASCVALPLAEGTRLIAVLVLRARVCGFFTAEEMLLLKQLVADISFALTHLSTQKRLTQLNQYDGLTGLPNRALFLERLRQAMHNARDDGEQLLVVVGNLRNFVSINTTLGRAAGDDVLRQVAHRLKAASRFPDRVARISGNLFASFLPNKTTASEPTLRMDHSLDEAFSEPFKVGTHEVTLTFQTGVSIYPVDADDADALLANAETALRRARNTGTRISFYEPRMHEEMARRMQVEMRLAQAFSGEEFTLHYQPKLEISTGNIIGLEALLRWQDDERTMMQPSQFVPLLEENGMIVDVGLWVIRRAMEDQSAWIAAGLPYIPVAVNVSAVQMREPNFVEEVLAILDKMAPAPASGWPAPWLEIELTESAAMEDIERTVAQLQQLRARDVQVAIDDFGTGHSSLGYLAQLPVSALKIDRSFVSGMTPRRDTMMIVDAIISLAHSLGLKVIAEGVETRQQMDLLSKLRCDEIQGYLFSPPLDAKGLTKFLGDYRR